MNLTKERADLNAELKRCTGYLRDKEIELPSHLKQTDQNILSTQEHIRLINSRLSEIAGLEAEAKALAATQRESARKLLAGTMDKIHKLESEISKKIPKADPTVKGRLFELSKEFKRILRGYTPKAK